MSRVFQPLMFLLARSSHGMLTRHVEFLETENEMLRQRVPKERIFLTAPEREKLLKLGKELGPAVRYLITIVSYSTFRRWVRKAEGRIEPTRKGRPRLALVIRQMVVLIAKETGWGYSRILGEIKKLKIGRISRQSVKNILIEHGLDPGPKRGKGTWSEFLQIHAETLWQADFFSKRVWTPQGPRQIFALVFIHVGTRRVFVTPGSFKPDATWMVRQARLFLDYAESERLGCQIVMRDLDGKYSRPFDAVFTDRKIQVKKVGPRAPNLNAFVERFVQSVKHEALNHFIVFGKKHFDTIVSIYVGYYHDWRPHQGLGNVPIDEVQVSRTDAASEEENPVTLPCDLSQIQCEARLGGLLRHYYRKAA